MTNKTAVRMNGATPWRTLDGQVVEVVINPHMTVREQYQAACRVARLPREKRSVERTLAGLSLAFYDTYAYKGARVSQDGKRPWLEKELKKAERRRVLFTAKPKIYVCVRRYSREDPLRIYGYLIGTSELIPALVSFDYSDESDQIWTTAEAMNYFDCYEVRQLSNYMEPNG